MSSKHWDDDIESRAALWILQVDRGELTAGERATFELWLSADPRHREAYLRLHDAWRVSAGFRSWRPLNGAPPQDIFRVEPNLRQTLRISRRFAVAAGFLVLLTGGLVVYQQFDSTSTYHTQVGGYQRVLLEDGSVLQLNTDSIVRVRLSSVSRRVELLRGEAYFDVEKDPTRSFAVITPDAVVRAIGTQFDVHSTPRGTEVTVAQGKVALSPTDAGLSAPLGRASAVTTEGQPSVGPTNSTLHPTLTLSAGQAARTNPTGINVATVAESEIARQFAWQTGELRFFRQPLAKVVAEFNRYNHRKVELADPTLANLEVGGNFKANDLESFINALKSMVPISVEMRTDRILLRGTSTPSTL